MTFFKKIAKLSISFGLGEENMYGEQQIVFEFNNVWYQIHAEPNNSWKHVLLPNQKILVHTNRISGPGEFWRGVLPIQALLVIQVFDLCGKSGDEIRKILSTLSNCMRAEAILEPRFTLDPGIKFPEEKRFVFSYNGTVYEYDGYSQITRYILLPDGRILEHVGDRNEKYAPTNPIQAYGFRVKSDLKKIKIPPEFVNQRFPLLTKAQIIMK